VYAASCWLIDVVLLVAPIANTFIIYPQIWLETFL